MKKVLVVCFLLLIICGCKNGEEILFCEGITPEGETFKCGNKFYSGDLTAVVKADKDIKEDVIMIKVIPDGKKSDSFQREIKTETNMQFYSIILPFYNEGKYSVKAYSGNSEIGSGQVEIIE